MSEPATTSVASTSPAARAVATARRRIRAALLFGGFVDGVAAVALLCAATLLVLRLFGVVPFAGALAGTASVSAWWIALVVVPVCTAVLRLRRADPSAGEVALYLDRRLGLEGLLLCGLEHDAVTWSSRLESELVDAPLAMPRLRWGRAAVRAALPLAALAGVILLPPPRSGPEHEFSAALNSALDRFEKRFEEIARHDGLREEAKQELEKRVETMKEREERGEPPSWSDLDAAEEKMAHEVARRAAELAKAKAEMSAFAGEKHESGETAKTEMAALIEDAEKADLLVGVSRETAANAGLDPSSAAGIDPKALKADAAALEALAKALAGTAGARLDALTEMGAIDPADLDALKTLMEGDPLAGKFGEGEEVCPECRGDRPEGCAG